MRQGGLTLGVGGGVVQAMQGTAETLEAIGKTDDQRMQALGAATAGLQIKQGLDTAGKAAASGNLADAGISVNISVGSSSSRSTSESSADSAQSSRVSAGGHVSFIAEGAGEDSDILVRGSEVNAGKTARMKAEGDVDLRAAQNTTKDKTESRNRSGSVGVGFQLGGGGAGFGITASASSGKGNAEGESLSYTNTHVTAGEKVIIESGGDTTLAGAVVSADRVEADIGGKLLIESLQDTATYREKSKQAGGSATFGAGGGGSFSASRTDVESEYASVSEQSGIRAGDGGFDVRVKGHTALVGGLIASSEPAERHGRNDFSTATLSHTDLHNSAHASARSEGMNLSSDMLTQGKYGVAKGAAINGLNTGSEAGSSSGQTLATIGEARITITDEAGQVARTWQTAEQTVASLHRDAETAHTAVIEQDRVALLKDAQAQQAIKAAAVRQVVVHTDAAYDALFVKDVKFYRVSCGTVPEDCVKDPGKVVLQEVSREEAKRDGKVLAVNGILNEKERAGQLAYQNAPLDQSFQKPEVIHLMHIQPADTSTGEVLAAGYEKKLAPVLGYSNADNAYADAIEGRGQEATLSLGHSRGTIVQNNAFNILADRGHVNENLRVLGVGGAVGVDEYTSSADRVNKNPETVEYVYMRNDPVSVIAAGNAGDALAAFKEFWNVLKTDNSAHSCYGTGAAGCKTIANPVAGGPVPTQQQSSNVMTYRGGKLVPPAGSKP